MVCHTLIVAKPRLITFSLVSFIKVYLRHFTVCICVCCNTSALCWSRGISLLYVCTDQNHPGTWIRLV